MSDSFKLVPCFNPDCVGGRIREKVPGYVRYVKDCPICDGTGTVPPFDFPSDPIMDFYPVNVTEQKKKGGA